MLQDKRLRGQFVAHNARTNADTHPGCGSQKELGWQQRLAGPQRRRGRLPTVDPRVRVSHRAWSGRREHQVLSHTHDTTYNTALESSIVKNTGTATRDAN